MTCLVAAVSITVIVAFAAMVLWCVFAPWNKTRTRR